MSIIYTQLNQYYVVLEVAPEYWQSPAGLKSIYFHPPGTSSVTASGNVPAGHDGEQQNNHHPACTEPHRIVSFGDGVFQPAPGMSLSDATLEIAKMQQELGTPSTVHGFFAGTLLAYQQSLGTEPLLVVTAILAVFIVLGVLYESLVHPITILSTLPSASVGAMMALMLFKEDLNVISIIGIVLLIGIVKKNAIMMIDFALQSVRARRGDGDGRRDLSGVYAAFSPNLDDNDGSVVWRVAAGFWTRYWLRAAAAARYHDCRGFDCEPDAYALYDPSCLSCARPSTPARDGEGTRYVSPCRHGGRRWRLDYGCLTL